MANHTEEHQHHITPFTVYNKVFWALIALTLLTVYTAKFIHLGALAAPVAVLIATTKAMLVMAYFMHLKYESNLNRIIFGTGFFFLALLYIICAIDVGTRILEKSTL